VYFTLQYVTEFWNVARRPTANNGLGLSVAVTLSELENIEGLLAVLPDDPAVYGEWKRLVVKHGVMGVKVHDVKLVAMMKCSRRAPHPHAQHR
jgi:hypothetical protein